ncbi:MAG: hypothetical protein U9Q23_02610 [Candidatus Bipolaricaulota bacterium]|nr:hypothetical protein [Candidatus Bipolaricaulota bacterium]
MRDNVLVRACHLLGRGIRLKTGQENGRSHDKKLLEVPQDMRVIALLPLGVPAYDSNQRTEIIRRKDLSELVRHETFSG